MTSFATSADLANRLGTTFTAAQEAQADLLLADATAYLQGELGQLVVAGSATATIYIPDGDHSVLLPQQPVTDVTGVSIDGTEVTDYEVVNGRLYLPIRRTTDPWGRPVEVSFSYGYNPVPAELVAWCCVLASQSLAMSKASGNLGGSAVRAQSSSIDGYSRSVSFVDGSHAYDIPSRTLDNLRARYGAGAYVTRPA